MRRSGRRCASPGRVSCAKTCSSRSNAKTALSRAFTDLEPGLVSIDVRPYRPLYGVVVAQFGTQLSIFPSEAPLDEMARMGRVPSLA